MTHTGAAQIHTSGAETRTWCLMSLHWDHECKRVCCFQNDPYNGIKTNNKCNKLYRGPSFIQITTWDHRCLLVIVLWSEANPFQIAVLMFSLTLREKHTWVHVLLLYHEPLIRAGAVHWCEDGGVPLWWRVEETDPWHFTVSFVYHHSTAEIHQVACVAFMTESLFILCKQNTLIYSEYPPEVACTCTVLL